MKQLPDPPTLEKPNKSFLGFSTDELANISVEDIVGNEPAIKMMMHYYKQLTEENSALKNQINTLETYVVAYDKKKTSAFVGALLLLLSNFVTGFGVNLLTNTNPDPAGWVVFGVGVTIACMGIYFNFIKQE